MEQKSNQSLYDSSFEHDACGIGAVVNIKGVPSHSVLNDALNIVEKLEHRAGKDASGETGDGVGIMTQIPHKFFKSELKKIGINLGNERNYGVGMLFFPQNEMLLMQAKKMFEIIVEKEGLSMLGWRHLPVNSLVLGQKAQSCMPNIMQCFISRPKKTENDISFDRQLYVVRRIFEQSSENTYVVSLSCRTIVYKGMFLVMQLRQFYLDLQSEKYETAIAMVHSRFSTNTRPSWQRAHPNRYILHNGEINTIKGNADRMLAREETMNSSVMREDIHKVFPVISSEGSDSAMLDNTIEFLVMNGIDLPLAMMLTIPESWRHDKLITDVKKDFYKYYSTMMEPWDGPASILFSDGDQVGAILDRNGLRPSRYYITSDDRLILSSEVGVLDIDEKLITRKSRLRPGKMLLINLKEGRVISDDELKGYYAARQPYGEWLDQNLVSLKKLPIPNKNVEKYTDTIRKRLYVSFGYSYEDVNEGIIPMALHGVEPTASMGTDIPLAVLSEKHQSLFSYFKQLFAQVTNPPIDALREECVTDTSVYIGSDGNLLQECAENCNVLEINNPILTGVDLLKIKSMKRRGFHVETLSLLYYKNTSLESAVENLFVQCDKAHRAGANILIISDRGVDENHIAIPSLLAVSAIEQYLVRTKRRTSVSIILESAEPREVHHFALILGYGARAVQPYLAHECIEEYIEKGVIDKDRHAAIDDFNSAILHGMVKIASKMGVSTLQSYQSSKIFEAVGINQNAINKYFSGTVSRVGGVGLKEIGEGVEYRHNRAFDPLGLSVDTTLPSNGLHRLRSGKDAEDHMYNPKTIIALREATQTGSFERFKDYTKLVDDESIPHTLRGLLEFNFDPEAAIRIEDVEPVSEIVKRIKTGAMSYGSISKEAHECMAVAMNRLGGKSNSGEGGEELARLNGDKNSAIKQVASGRFGVTSEYLLSAKEIQIKMAQGAKPGEGGHLPGKKVYPWIAKTRHSTAGVSLISPPPHHDIYSIEDLAQLIFDLKNANRKARISVKLVSEVGVGTIASGVAKAGAQIVLISGYDGGTGAAPKSSIHHAGLPWELGLAEAHQTLIQNGLRTKVILETDGKLMSGRDVAIAAILGAEEFGFATAPLITMGCVMMRVCNHDTCPVGIATQNPKLRNYFCGKPEYIINFMEFIAQELREIMAALGVSTVNELIGRTELIKVREKFITKRTSMIDLSKILNRNSSYNNAVHFDPDDIYDFKLKDTLDEKVLIEKLGDNIENGTHGKLSVCVSSINRTFGTILGSVITERHGNKLADDTYVIDCKGGGGQSFGAFIPKGLTLRLEGDSNDYFGKGLSGGKLVVNPPKHSNLAAEENVIIGNVALYGATGGEAYINGIAGERFCVRNSGASAVVEGIGDHGCEYMTGGRVVIIGSVGKNFAAGMSGGTAYVLDNKHDLYLKLNKEMVVMSEATECGDIDILKTMLKCHIDETGSKLGTKILASFVSYLPHFKKIVPVDYKKILSLINHNIDIGMTPEDAELEAFYSL